VAACDRRLGPVDPGRTRRLWRRAGESAAAALVLLAGLWLLWRRTER
jgi:hypothetical protein